MNRRTFLSSLAATTAVSGAAISSASPVSNDAEKTAVSTKRAAGNHKPKNVVLMICDDLGYGDLGCYGGSLPTPHLDALAKNGMRLTHFNAGHAICSASRAALLTGRYAPRSHTPGALFPNAEKGMSLDEVTLAELLRKKGYSTHAVGKWHLGDREAYLPTNRGFDDFYGVPYSDDMQPLPLIRNTTILQADADRDELTPLYTEDALKFLKGTGDRPFFLYLAFSYPHDPARASKAFAGKTAFGDYGDSVAEIDWSVGQVVDELRRQNKLGDTLILFTSDHGPWFQGTPGNLRGRKGSTFEGGFRVPLIAHWPSGIHAGAESATWASNLDIVPTLTNLCGLQPSKNPVDGIDISELLRTGSLSTERHPVLYFSPRFMYEIHCIRKGNWKLRVAQTSGQIYINDGGAGRQGYWLQHPELYNLEQDPAESYDIAAKHPEIVKELTANLDEQIGTFPPEVAQAMVALKANRARITTPPGAAARLDDHKPLPDWAWEPPSRR